MAVDLWETVTGTLDPRSHYAETATFAELTGALATGAIDVAVTNLTITRDRVERIDFTQRMRAG